MLVGDLSLDFGRAFLYLVARGLPSPRGANANMTREQGKQNNKKRANMLG